MSNQRFGIKEVADMWFYKLNADGTKGEAVLCLDTLKVSNIEQTAEQTEAKGGKGNAPFLVWDHGKEVNIVLEDALLSEKSLEIVYGDKENGTITISARTFPGIYYIVGRTFARDMKTGKDKLFSFVIPRAKVVSENTITMEAEGDPTVFNMTLRALRGKDGQMVKLILGVGEDDFKYEWRYKDWDETKPLYSIVDISDEIKQYPNLDIVFPATHEGKQVYVYDFVTNDSKWDELRPKISSVKFSKGAQFFGRKPDGNSTMAFMNCENLTHLDLGDLESLPSYSFSQLGITELFIPETLSSLNGCFEGCPNLISITGGRDDSSLYVRENGVYQNNSLTLGCKTTKIIENTGINRIDSWAFYKSIGLTSINIPSNIKTIGGGAFAYTGLTSIIIPDSVVALESSFGGAFSGCKKLKTAIIGRGTNSISSDTFNDCTNLTDIYLPGHAEGTISHAPWGAVNATIHWNEEAPK